MEELSLGADEQGQYPAGVGVLLAGIAEDVVLLAVPVQIQAELDTPLLAEVMYSFFELEQLRVEKPGGLPPATVEVDPRHIASEIPVNDPVHIHHRKDLEDEVLEQVLRLRAVLEESPHYPLADVG